MKKILLQNSWIELGCRFIIGIVFIYASYHKITEPAQFAKIIYGYALFPGVIINIIAILLPYIEMVMGAALITGIYPRAAALILSGVLILFMLVITINLVRGHEFDCGCFSLKNSPLHQSAAMLLLRDTFYFLMSIYVITYKNRRLACLHQIENV